jgi:hypothetical protein
MMRLWKVSYAQPSPLGGATGFSVVAHAVLIGASIVATRAPSSMPSESLANRVYYIPPPDRPSHPMGSRETVHYISVTPGFGAGPGPMGVDSKKPAKLSEHSADAGTTAVDSVAAPPLPGDVQGDSVFSELEVDSVAVRSQLSAAPAYPLDLLAKHIEGGVIARYVVDTTGFADLESLEVLQSTNDGFLKAVRDALPYMRFSPAKIGKRKVRQLVEQPFTFRIAPATPTVATPKP